MRSNDNCLLCELSSLILAEFSAVVRAESGYRTLALRPELYTLTSRRLGELRDDMTRIFAHAH